MSDARFEVVRTTAGFHARFKAANNRTVFATENYTRRRSAENAIKSFTGQWIRGAGTRRAEVLAWWPSGDYPVQVRYIDEREDAAGGAS